MSVRRVDADDALDDAGDGWFGWTPITDPAPLQALDADAAAADLGPAVSEDPTADTDSWQVPVEFVEHQVREDASSTPVAAPRRDSWESRLSSSGAWDFKVAPATPWYRSRAGLIVAVVLVSLVSLTLALFLRTPSPAPDEPTSVTPSQPTAPPPPTSSAPALSTPAPAPLPPPPLPPPPPPPPPMAEEMSPPVVNRQYSPGYQTPEAPKKPQTNVTRAPMSATPPPPPPDTNHGRATPGDSPPHGFFG